MQKRLDWNPDQNWAKCPAMVCYILTMHIHTQCKPKSVGAEHLRCWSHETFLPYLIWKDELQTAPSDGGQMSLTAIRYIYFVNCPWQVHLPSLLHIIQSIYAERSKSQSKEFAFGNWYKSLILIYGVISNLHVWHIVAIWT